MNTSQTVAVKFGSVARSHMKITRLKISWDRRFPMRTAVQLVQVTRRFNSRILLRVGTEVADARSVLSILLIAATLTTYLDIETSGDDEQEAMQAVTEQLSHRSPH